MNMLYDVYLASSSPRRKMILETIGIKPRICIADIDEKPLEGEDAIEYVMRLAYEKVDEAKGHIFATNALVIGGDTIVVKDGNILQKPIDAIEAKEMLKSLSGTSHKVLTGLSMIDQSTEKIFTGYASTTVVMRDYDALTIDAYIKTQEPMDKAGAYGIQGIGATLVESVHGDYNTVVGLPVSLLMEGFKQLNIDFFSLIG